MNFKILGSKPSSALTHTHISEQRVKYVSDSSFKSTASLCAEGGAAAAASVAPGAAAASAAASGDSDTIPTFQAAFIRSVVEEAMEDVQEQLRKDILNLHMDMLKQFQLHQVSIITFYNQLSILCRLPSQNSLNGDKTLVLYLQ